ncbi:MAG: hypothetical protein ACOC2M_04005 [bacterium]
MKLYKLKTGNYFMSIPAEKLNKMLEELLNKQSESAKELNIISLEEYRELNADKVAYLNFLKDRVSVFNAHFNKCIDILANVEIMYLTAVKLSSLNEFNKERKDRHKQILKDLNGLFFIQNIILNDIKTYPNPRLKKNTLKIDDKTYKSFLRVKNRLLKIEQEIEQTNFAPQNYMNDALENIEHIIKKYEEYKDNPESFLAILEYYYADLEDLEWTDENREFVAKNYA